MRTTYFAFVARLQLVGSQLDGLYSTKVKNNRSQTSNAQGRTSSEEATSSKVRGGTQRRQDDNNKNNDKTPAKWVSKDELARRKEENLCLRCGKEGHMIRNCALGPAVRPVEAKKANPADPVSDEESDGDQGKV